MDETKTNIDVGNNAPLLAVTIVARYQKSGRIRINQYIKESLLLPKLVICSNNSVELLQKKPSLWKKNYI